MIIKGKYDCYAFSEENLIKKKGKFNSVYSGKKLSDNSKVIIKKINQSLKNDEIALNRFKNEAKINFDHQNIAKTLEYIEFENEHYLIKNYVEGIDFQKFYSNRKLYSKANQKFYLKCLKSALNGLREIHKRGIIHRDIRPTNLILEYKNNSQKFDYENPNIKIIDFGLAKFRKTDDNRKKTPFALIYSPPEQILNFNNLVNESSDLYSLAISFYEIITRNKPFYYANPEVIINLQISQKLVYNKKINAELFKILLKASEKYFFKKSPNKYSHSELENYLSEGIKLRYQSADEMISDLHNINIRDTDKGLFSIFRF